MRANWSNEAWSWSLNFIEHVTHSVNLDDLNVVQMNEVRISTHYKYAKEYDTLLLTILCCRIDIQTWEGKPVNYIVSDSLSISIISQLFHQSIKTEMNWTNYVFIIRIIQNGSFSNEIFIFQFRSSKNSTALLHYIGQKNFGWCLCRHLTKGELHWWDKLRGMYLFSSIWSRHLKEMRALEKKLSGFYG